MLEMGIPVFPNGLKCKSDVPDFERTIGLPTFSIFEIYQEYIGIYFKIKLFVQLENFGWEDW